MAEAARLIADGAAPPDIEDGQRSQAPRGSQVPDYGSAPQDGSINPDEHMKKIRKDFIIKVYSILALQITFTALIAAFIMYHPSVGEVAKRVFFEWEPTFMNWLYTFLYGIPVIVTLVMLFLYGDQYPQNFLWLMLFTVLMAFPIGGACYQMQATGQGAAVLYATGVTALVFLSITLLVMCVKFEDSTMIFVYLFVYSLLLVNVFLGFFALICGWSLGIWLYNVLGVIIFTGYILFDTWLILEKTDIQHVDTRFAIFGAVKLYIDIINLFIHILSLMRRR